MLSCELERLNRVGRRNETLPTNQDISMQVSDVDIPRT